MIMQKGLVQQLSECDIHSMTDSDFLRRFVFTSTFAVEVLLKKDWPVAEFRDQASGREGGFGILVDNCLFKQCTKVRP